MLKETIMGFKDFSKNYNHKSFEGKDEINNNKRVEDIYEKYKDKNEDELLSELFKNVAKQKQEGTFDINLLNEMASKMSPFLTKEQNLKLKEIINQIK